MVQAKRIAVVIMTAVTLTGIVLVSAREASAQWRRDGRRDNDRWERNRDYRRDRDDRDYRDDRDRDYRYRNDRYRRDRRYDDRYRRDNRYGYGYNSFERARREGYQQGLYTGSSDARRGQSYNPQRSRYYKNADSGYNSRYGARGQYRQAYRQGFLLGYREGYQRYGGYNNRRGYGGWFPW